jgi:DNA invertase Pin-like site-specific DNA recombinase
MSDTIVAYLRVSTQEQQKSGLGLEAQRDAIQKFSLQENFEVAGWHTDILSGKGSDAEELRPNLKQALAHAKKLRCPLVVSKLDRLSRDSHYITGLMSRGILFYIAEYGKDCDPFMIQIYAAVSQKERDLIAQRTRDALAAKKRRGHQLGNRTNLNQAQKAGTLRNQQRSLEFAERVMGEILRYRRLGASYGSIADSFNRLGIPAPKGGQWQATQISRILAKGVQGHDQAA